MQSPGEKNVIPDVHVMELQHKNALCRGILKVEPKIKPRIFSQSEFWSPTPTARIKVQLPPMRRDCSLDGRRQSCCWVAPAEASGSAPVRAVSLRGQLQQHETVKSKKPTSSHLFYPH